jgi:NADH-quinone oxidoreductase subunit L
MTWVAAGVPVLPFLAAAVGLLGGRRVPGGPAAVALAGAGASAVLALVLLLAGTGAGARVSSAVLTQTGGPVISVGVRVTTLSAAAALSVALVALAVQVFSVGYLRVGPRYSSYAAFVSLFTAAMLTVVLAADLIEAYAAWEVMGACSYFLIGHRWEEPRHSAAAVKAFLMTRIGDVAMLFGIFVLGSAAGSFGIPAVLAAVPRMPHHLLLAGTLLILTGVAGKSGQFPLHTWLPDAMAGPAPVSALIHAATMVAAGVYVIATLYPVFLAAPLTLDVMAVLAAISMLGAALAALAQDDLKRVLAYSTMSQLALMLGGLAAGDPPAALFHLLTHAAFKALLFLGAGAVITVTGTSLMSRMARRPTPLTFVTMTAGFAALAAVPPASGFFSKDSILAAMARAVAGHGPITPGAAGVLYAAALLTTAVTAAYVTRAWLRTFFTGAGLPAAREAGRPGDLPMTMAAPLAALAVPAVTLGVLVVPFGTLRPGGWSALVSVLLVAAGVLACVTVWRADPAADPARALGRLRPAFAHAFYADDLYDAAVVRPVLALARAVGRADRGVLDRGAEGSGRGAIRLGGVLRLTQNGNAQAYATGVLAGAVVIALSVAVLA